MKIVFSRKGWDSSAGGAPSPIFPSGEICSMPIPEPGSLKLGQLAPRHITSMVADLGSLAADLTRRKRKNRMGPHTPIHLDPFLCPDSLGGAFRNWRPAFGQESAAATHLTNNAIGSGDLFLFFGLFRKVYKDRNGNWSYEPKSYPIHLMWGWLQVENALDLKRDPVHSGLKHHPHVINNNQYGPKNLVFLPTAHLRNVGGIRRPGAGIFTHFHSSRQLTVPNYSCSKWRLPSWFGLQGGIGVDLTYHEQVPYHKNGANEIVFTSRGRGQEFVFDSSKRRHHATSYLQSVFR